MRKRKSFLNVQCVLMCVSKKRKWLCYAPLPHTITSPQSLRWLSPIEATLNTKAEKLRRMKQSCCQELKPNPVQSPQPLFYSLVHYLC